MKALGVQSTFCQNKLLNSTVLSVLKKKCSSWNILAKENIGNVFSVMTIPAQLVSLNLTNNVFGVMTIPAQERWIEINWCL